MYKMSGYISGELHIQNWDDIKPYFEKLISDMIASTAELEQFITHYSEVLSVYAEQHARAYIDMTCHTDNEAYQKRYEIFATIISPEIDKLSHEIEKKISAHPCFKDLPEKRYEQLKKELLINEKLYREENLELSAEVSKWVVKYNQCAGRLTVSLDGRELTIPQAAVHLESPDRALRKKAWLAIMQSRQAVQDELNDIFSQMLGFRHKIAQNAGYENYRDYKHDDLHRLDYEVDDVLTLHEVTKNQVLPLVKKIEERHIKKLGLSSSDYFSWDVKAKPQGEQPLKPFKTGKELLEKTIAVFQKVSPAFSQNLRTMQKNNFFDLESRPNKAPGGYNYGLEVTGMPFIFMNAAGMHSDVLTLMHEGGHAAHTFLTNTEPLIQYRNSPAEIAEVASMSMELISSKYWGAFYDEKQLIKAQLEHLEDIIGLFPWVATVDSFQHWLYTHPHHTVAERGDAFKMIFDEFSTGLVNWSGFEAYRKVFWQKQMHIFEVPFYYVEYAIAQLGALQIYQNYVKDPKSTIQAYEEGLRLGSSLSISEVWKTLGITFDFSEKAMVPLMNFVASEWQELNERSEKI